jgi:hypothetical protein
MARPSKFTPEREAKIVEALAAGNTRQTACKLAGVSDDSFRRWLDRFAGFAASVEKAEAVAESSHVANIKAAAADGSWTASAWWLERRRHEDWGKKDRLEITATIRQLVKDAGLGEDVEAEAVAEAQSILKELRGARR